MLFLCRATRTWSAASSWTGVSAISSGLHDGVNLLTNAAGENLPLTGTYSVSADNSGRGTLTLNTFAGVQTIAFYIVSKGHLMLAETAPLISQVRLLLVSIPVLKTQAAGLASSSGAEVHLFMKPT